MHRLARRNLAWKTNLQPTTGDAPRLARRNLMGEAGSST